MSDIKVKNNFIKTYRNIISDSRLSPTDKLVFQAIQFYYDLNPQNKQCTASETHIAEFCCVSKRSVIRSIKELRKRCLISVTKEDGDKLIILINNSDFEKMMVKKLPSTTKQTKSVKMEPVTNSHRGVPNCHPIQKELLRHKETETIKSSITNDSSPTSDKLSHPFKKLNPNLPKKEIEALVADINSWPLWVLQEQPMINKMPQDRKEILRNKFCYGTHSKEEIIQDINWLLNLDSIIRNE